MKLCPLLIELQPQRNGLRRAQHIKENGFRLHIITIIGIPTGYRLIRTVTIALTKDLIGTQHVIEEQIGNFRNLSDLFIFAKQKGFFEDVTPYATGWKGYSEWIRQIQKERDYQYTSSYDEEEEEDNDTYDYEQARREEEIDYNWERLGKHETIGYNYEQFDDYESYEFNWDEPDDDELDEIYENYEPDDNE